MTQGLLFMAVFAPPLSVYCMPLCGMYTRMVPAVVASSVRGVCFIGFNFLTRVQPSGTPLTLVGQVAYSSAMKSLIPWTLSPAWASQLVVLLFVLMPAVARQVTLSSFEQLLNIFW